MKSVGQADQKEQQKFEGLIEPIQENEECNRTLTDSTLTLDSKGNFCNIENIDPKSSCCKKKLIGV